MTIAEIILSLAVGFLIVESYFRHRENKKLSKGLDELNNFRRDYNGFRYKYYKDKVQKLSEIHKDDLELISNIHEDVIHFIVDLGSDDGICAIGTNCNMKYNGLYVKNYRKSLTEFNAEIHQLKQVKEKLCCKKGKK